MGGTSKKIQRGTPGLAAVLAVCLMACCAGEARAASVDYTLSGNSHIWSSGGINSTVQGDNIKVSDVIGVNTPANSGAALPFSDALFSFTSGTYASSNGDKYTYGSNGTFNVIGSFDLNGNGTLESGEKSISLLSGTIGPLVLDRSSASQYKISSSNLTVTNYALASYFGYPVGTLFTGAMNLAFNVSTVPDDFQGGEGTSGDISTNPVPLPGAAMLLFSGLAGLFGLRRRSETLDCHSA